MKHKITFYIILGALLLGTFSCTKKENLESKIITPTFTRTINNKELRFENNRITELTKDDNNEAVYGVISDIHGEVNKARFIAEELKKRNVEGIIVTGDIPKNEILRYDKNDSKEDKQEIIDSLEAVAESNLPVFVIPGNHESKSDYESALRILSERHSNIIDMTKYRIFDGDDVDFVSLPGYQDKRFVSSNGYYASPDEINNLGNLRNGLSDSVVLITHGAGKTNSINGPASLYDGKDVGDSLTSEVQQKYNIPFALVGHIHEAAGHAATFNGIEVKQNEFSSQFTANFGTLEKWENIDGNTYNATVGIFTIKGNLAKYEMIYL